MDNLAYLINNVDQEPIKEGFKIDSPEKADWAINKIKAERSRRDMFIQVANGKISALQQQIKDATERCNNDTSFLLQELSNYMELAPAKETKTQKTLILPSGKMIKKFAKVDYCKDDKALLEYVKEAAPELVKVTEKPDWAELKKDLEIQGDVVIRKSTGEIVDCITIEQKPESFDVE